MNTIILYASKYGGTEKAVKQLKEELKGNASMINLKTEDCSDLNDYDTIIFASPVYVGRIRDEVKKYIDGNKEDLDKRNVALLLCCKDSGEKFDEILKINFPSEVIEKAFIKKSLGHEIQLEKMSFFERFLLKYIFKVKKSYSEINYNAIKEIANEINEMKRIQEK